jgi:hypothetical protein
MRTSMHVALDATFAALAELVLRARAVSKHRGGRADDGGQPNPQRLATQSAMAARSDFVRGSSGKDSRGLCNAELRSWRKAYRARLAELNKQAHAAHP